MSDSDTQDDKNPTVDTLIDRLWNTTKMPTEKNILSKEEIKYIINKSKQIIAFQPVFLELVPPLVVCGDIHGQFFDLLRIFEKCGDPSRTNYLFLGDYVDRGKQSVETISLLLLYKIKYPRNFFLLRGNHEASLINKQYGFYDECLTSYHVSVWRWFNDVFDWLPISAMIDNRILCIHGGISPELKNFDQLRQINRPIEIPENGLICDLLWSDPDSCCDHFNESERGTSVVFGQKPLQDILDKLGLDLLVRAHQAISGGYDFPFIPIRNVVTVFSAPNYCGEYGNCGAVMTVNEQMVCKFIVFEPNSIASGFMKKIQRPVVSSFTPSILTT